MKTVILLALVAVAAAVPTQYSFEAVQIPHERSFSGEYTWLDKYFGQGNTFQVPQYIAYQFHYFQQLGYTPAQVSEYFVKYGYPTYVVQYLTQEYEAGLTKEYFQVPYFMYQYYLKQGIPQEVQEYINQHIYNYFQQFQKYFVTYGMPSVFDQEYSVPLPFHGYMSQQLRFYTQKGFDFEQIQFAYQNLRSVLQYTQNMMQYFVKGTISKEMYAYVYEHLQYAFLNLQQAERIYQTYLINEQHVPYYVFQYYVKNIQQAFFYFQNVFQYIQTERVAFPESFLNEISNVYLAIKKVYQMYETLNWFESYYKPTGMETSYFGGKRSSYDYDFFYPSHSQESKYNWFGKYMNKDKYFDNQKYGYQYGSFDRYFNSYTGSSIPSYYPYETSQYRWGYEPSYKQYGKTYAY